MSDGSGDAPAFRDIVTLDGPAASGKSSVARGLALALGIPAVSSGLLYRAATYLVAKEGLDGAELQAVMDVLGRHRVELLPGVDGDRVLVDGDDVTRYLHTDAVDGGVSWVAAHPQVRTWVSDRLREMPPPFVIDGRDMGSVVFPHAKHKFYLHAAPEVRAARRVGERAADLEQVTEAIRRRDALDARQLAPAADALQLDTGPLTLDEVVSTVLARIRSSTPTGVRSAITADEEHAQP